MSYEKRMNELMNKLFHINRVKATLMEEYNQVKNEIEMIMEENQLKSYDDDSGNTVKLSPFTSKRVDYEKLKSLLTPIEYESVVIEKNSVRFMPFSKERKEQYSKRKAKPHY